MTDRPILFSRLMVQALLAGHKTMTRRLAWHAVAIKRVGHLHPRGTMPGAGGPPHVMAPAGKLWAPTLWQKVKPGDRLWVRETWRPDVSERAGCWADSAFTYYAADAAEPGMQAWRSSMMMSRERSRLTLRVSAVRAEPVQDISEYDAHAEGVAPAVAGTLAGRPISRYRTGFVRTWAQLHGTDSWLENPTVVAVTFSVHHGNIDKMESADAARQS